MSIIIQNTDIDQLFSYHQSMQLEQSAVSRTGCIVAHHILTETENISLLLEFSGPLVANSLFPPMLYAGTSLTV